MCDTCSLQVVQHLSLVLICNGLTCFQFDNKAVVDHEIGEVLANNNAVFIVNSDRVLLLDAEARFPQTINQCVFTFSKNFSRYPFP